MMVKRARDPRTKFLSAVNEYFSSSPQNDVLVVFLQKRLGTSLAGDMMYLTRRPLTKIKAVEIAINFLLNFMTPQEIVPLIEKHLYSPQVLQQLREKGFDI